MINPDNPAMIRLSTWLRLRARRRRAGRRLQVSPRSTSEEVNMGTQLRRSLNGHGGWHDDAEQKDNAAGANGTAAQYVAKQNANIDPNNPIGFGITPPPDAPDFTSAWHSSSAAPRRPCSSSAAAAAHSHSSAAMHRARRALSSG
jgi:hypothetical protein